MILSKSVLEHETSRRNLNVLWLLSKLWAEEVNGCLHGPLNQMAITILHANARLSSALATEPQGKFTSGFPPKVLKQTFLHKVRILTSETSWPDITSWVKFPTSLPLSHYIVNVRLVHNGQKHFTLQMKVPFPTILCLHLGLLTPRWPHQLHEKQLVKALTAVVPSSQSFHSLTRGSAESGVSPFLLSGFTAELPGPP